jgi:hypothetical protein
MVGVGRIVRRATGLAMVSAGAFALGAIINAAADIEAGTQGPAGPALLLSGFAQLGAQHANVAGDPAPY